MRDDGRSDLMAIPTEYKGRLYRSRTEARWAVFFDVAGIEVQYEPDGFVVGGISYIPDFFVPAWGLFIEVKPLASPSARDREKCQKLAEASEKRVLMVLGDPGMKKGLAFEPKPNETVDGQPATSAFLGHCRRCPRIVLCLVWGQGNDAWGWGEHALDGPCPQQFCTDKLTYFGSGFEEAIRAACDYRWQPNTS